MNRRIVLDLWWQDVRKLVRVLRNLAVLCRHAWRAAWEPASTDDIHEDVLDTLAWQTAMVGAGWELTPEGQDARAVLDEKGLPRAYTAQVRLTAALLSMVPFPDDQTDDEAASIEAQLSLLQDTAMCIQTTRGEQLAARQSIMTRHPSGVGSSAHA